MLINTFERKLNEETTFEKKSEIEIQIVVLVQTFSLNLNRLNKVYINQLFH